LIVGDIKVKSINKKENKKINGLSKWYYGEDRRCNFAKWNKNENQFEYIRYKFGHFWDRCNHFEDDDGFALFVPIRKATDEEIQIQERLLS